MTRRVCWSKGKRGRPHGWVRLNTPWPLVSVEMIGDECHILPGGEYVGRGRVSVPMEIGTDWEVEERDDRWILTEVKE